MSVTTRSKYRALPAIQDALPVSPTSETIKDSSDTRGPNDTIQDRILSQGSRKAKRPPSPSQKPRKRKPQERTRKQRELNQEERPQTATTLTHFPRHTCSCSQGAFHYPVDSCVRCGHDTDDHYDQNHPWRVECDYACTRPDLVSSVLRMARDRRVVVIRATPMVGKTILLQLLGYHIVYQEHDLEPVFIDWKRRDRRDNLPYAQYLQQEASAWRERNAEYRPNNPNARTIYLIDEAQGSYEEEDFWGRTLKQHDTRRTPIFVLVCLYGAAALSCTREPTIESQAQRMDCIHRVELRPIGGGPFMLFKPEETRATIQKWALQNKFRLRDGTWEYIHTATDGHPGVVGLILLHFQICFRNVSAEQFLRKEYPNE